MTSGELTFLIVIFVVASSFWVFVDAPRYGMAKWWGIGAFFLWPVFFPLYLLVRTSQRQVDEPPGTGEAPPPGWYGTPEAADGRERWWDGHRWTEHERQA